LSTHELTALLALIEIENKQQPVDSNNYVPTTQAVKKLCHSQVQKLSSELQRLILIGAYYSKPIKQIILDMD